MLWQVLRAVAISIGIHATAAAVDETVRVKIRDAFNKGKKSDEEKTDK